MKVSLTLPLFSVLSGECLVLSGTELSLTHEEWMLPLGACHSAEPGFRS